MQYTSHVKDDTPISIREQYSMHNESDVEKALPVSPLLTSPCEVRSGYLSHGRVA
jgi:hypothetical protein